VTIVTVHSRSKQKRDAKVANDRKERKELLADKTKNHGTLSGPFIIAKSTAPSKPLKNYIGISFAFFALLCVLCVGLLFKVSQNR
jgi:hypothetical protein